MNLSSNQNKKDWCKFGQVWEHVFIGLYGKKLGLIINPAKYMASDGKYHPDLYSYRYSMIADLKREQEPFYTSLKYNIEPQYATTINVVDIKRYKQKYSDILIYFWVTFCPT